MGDEISMKTRVLFFLLMLCSASLANNSQAEMEHYDQLFSAINEQRKGLSDSELKSLSDPFLKLTTMVLLTTHLICKLFLTIRLK